MTSKISALTAVSSKHFFTDRGKTYRVDKLFTWINEKPEKHKSLPIHLLLKYIVHDTWNNFEELKKTNFQLVFDDSGHRQRMMQVDLQYPIIITNFNRLVDGVHRIFKAVFEKKGYIKAVFIDQSQLSKVCIDPLTETRKSVIEGVSFPDQYLQVSKDRLPKDVVQIENLIEDYFPDFLPTATDQGEQLEIRLERPSSPYGCYMHDDTLKSGLSWWNEGTRVRDIPKEYRLQDEGILAVEEQWVPLSWSHAFQRLGKIPDEVVLLHLDDHQDMMAPRIGTRLDGEMVDYMTGDQVNFLDPESVANAVKSGAIGKGSILTPLIWSIPKVHVRHLTFRPHPNTTYRIDKVTYSDEVLFESKNRIGLHFSDTSWKNLTQHSNYVVTPNFDTWVDQIPPDVPILLHFDLDYFNNRFDGNSDWQTDPGSRSHNPRFVKQKQYLKSVFQRIHKLDLSDRIIDTSIGISPGFYPGEFWKPMVSAINKEMNLLGVGLKEKQMSTSVVTRGTNKQNVGLEVVEEKEESKRNKKISARAKRKIQEAELSSSASESTSSKKPKRKKVKKIIESSAHVLESSVVVEKMASKKFEGWKIKLDGEPCGSIKFEPKVDKTFGKHVTFYFKVPKPKRGRHVGRFALAKAIDASKYNLFVGHLRKSNIASKKALSSVGFKEFKNPKGNQLCMVFRKV